LKFKDVSELEKKVSEYFDITKKEEWTITGLAIHLDTFRSVLCDYELKDEFSNTIKKAKQKVEHSYEVDLKKSGRTGTIFALKNFNWVDKQELT
jgi:predicted transcriptional regulator